MASTAIQREEILFQRIYENDRTAITECIDTYGNYIWALARKHTASNEKAETAAQEIFEDIWQYAMRGRKSHISEKVQIALIVRRRLIKLAANGVDNSDK